MQPSTLVPEGISQQLALTVNGVVRAVPAGFTVADLLVSLGLDARTVVIEHNGTILRDRSSFASLQLSTQDSLEIVHFVGGG
jgi:thiamine biosynthesis protein ThiS